MKKVVKAVIIGVGVAATIFAIFKIVKKVSKKNEGAPKCWTNYSDENENGI